MSEYFKMDGAALDRYITGNYGEDQETRPVTREDVEALKASWVTDACWDIEDTEGFEAYREELIAFSQQMQAQWKAEQQRKREQKAEELGVPGNLALADYVTRLEQRIADLEKNVEAIASTISW